MRIRNRFAKNQFSLLFDYDEPAEEVITMNEKLFEHAFADNDHKKTYTIKEAMDFFWDRGLIDKGELAEQAIAKTIKIDQNAPNTMGSDLVDGSEIKYSEVYYDRTTTYATIGGIKNKTGTIRAWVYEQKNTKINYYFIIPYNVYSQYFEDGKKSTMKIWFDSSGNPRRPMNHSNADLWDHSVSEKDFMEFKQ
jgi:hypothetical protein